MSNQWWEDLSIHFKTTRGFPLPEVMRDQAENELKKLSTVSLMDAVRKVKASNDTSQDLVDALGVGLTWFNREYRGIAAIVESHKAMQTELGRNTTWLWSVGCSMGQEPYSIAIALLEAGAHPVILATDFNREHLHIARRGRYAAEKLRLVPSEIRETYFTRTRDGQYQVTPELRRCVTFELHNFAITERQPDGWANLDGVICRNALIYYDASEATRIAGNLCRSLRPGGFFLVGSVDRPVLRRLKIPEISQAGLAIVRSPNRVGKTSADDSEESSSWKPRTERAPSSSLDLPSWARPAAVTPPPPTEPVRTPPPRPTPPPAEPSGADTLMGTADELSRARREDESLALLQSGVKRYPLAAAIHLMLGISLKRSGDIPAAIDELRAARFLDSNGWLAAYYLAGCLEIREPGQEAQRALRDTLRLIESKQPACCSEIPGTGDLATLASTVAASCRSRLSSGT